MKYNLELKGLDCANCAAKLERAISKIEGLDKVNISFMEMTLSFNLLEDELFEDKINEINTLIAKIEPETIIVKYPRKHNHEHSEHCHCDEHQKEENHEEIEINDNLKEKIKNLINIIRIALTSVLLIIGLCLEFFTQTDKIILMIIYLVAYIVISYDILIQAIKNILHGKIFDETFLMTIASIGALSISQFEEGVAVMLFYQIGELFQRRAVNSSRKSIRSLISLKTDYANVETNGEIIKTTPENLKIGDIIIIKPGEKIPIDGKIIFGSTSLDNSSLTGEAKPVDVFIGDEISSGGINLSAMIKLQVTTLYQNSNIAKIMKLVEESRERKSKSENFITKFSKYYTPSVVIIALLLCLIPWLFFNQDFNDWLYRSLMFLVISCPCALVISVPLAFFAGIGNCSENGILVKGGNYLEKLSHTDTIVFDKTGTLTKGNFQVNKIFLNNIDQETFLSYVTLCEAYSNHPVAKSIIEYAKGMQINHNSLKSIEEIPGFGMVGNIEDHQILCGNTKLLDKYKVKYIEHKEVGTMIHVARDKQYLGYILIIDEIKQTAIRAIELLKKHKIKATIMLTGDNKEVAEQVQKEVGIDIVYSSLYPQDKVRILEEMMASKNKKSVITFVGDGTNDAPALMVSDVGIAMGGLGSDAARESCDLVIMDDNLEKISTAIKISRFTVAISMQNIVFALFIKLIILILGALNLVPMIVGVIADVGVSMIAILNSIRIIKKRF